MYAESENFGEDGPQRYGLTFAMFDKEHNHEYDDHDYRNEADERY